jgi:type I restriction enzyme M protein
MAFIYEGLLKDVRDAAGTAGEFYTPRPVIRFMVKNSFLAPESTVLDPACGTGGFLVESFIELSDKWDKDKAPSTAMRMRGIEKKPLPFLLGTMNLLLHEMAPSVLVRENALAKMSTMSSSGRVDAVLTNPPFGGEEEPAVFQRFAKDYRTRETSWLFLVSAMDALKREGKCAIVVPNSVLFDEGIGFLVKKRFESEFSLHTVVRLPEGVFSPYTKIPTNLLFFERGRTETVWFYQVPVAGGGKSYTKKKPLKDQDLKDCSEWWGGPDRLGRVVTDSAWSISVESLKARHWNLDLRHPNDGKTAYGSSADLLNQVSERSAEVRAIIDALLPDVAGTSDDASR